MTDAQPSTQSLVVENAALARRLAAAVEETVEPAPMTPSPVPPRPAFRAIYDAEFGYVWNTLRRLGAPERDLEDLAHDVFVALHRTFATYDPGRPIRPFLFGIAFRVASDDRRRARHRYEVMGSEREPVEGAPGAEERLDSDARRRLVIDALQVLDRDRRAVFVMHDLDGHSMPEIATVLAVPLNTLYSRLRLARGQFALEIKRRRERGTP